MNYRINKKEKFTQIDNEVLRDKELTMEGLALLVRLLSRPDNWKASIGELVKNGKEKSWTEGAIKRGFKNLKDTGYAKLVKIYNIDSKVMQGSYYEIFEDTESGKLFPNIIYVDSNKNEVEKQTASNQTGQLSDRSETQPYNKKEDTNNEQKNIYISSHSSDKDILLEEKQTNIVFEATHDLVSESLTKNIDGNCTLPSQDSIKQSLPQEKNYKYLQNKERFDFIREKTKYWNDNSPESARIKSGKKGEKGNDWCLKKLYEMVGKEKAEVVFDSVMSMPNRKPFYLVSSDILQQTLATYQDPNQETPKYLSNSLYERQSRYKGGDIPDDKMISSEATFYASLEWHFSDRYEGAELVKKVREFIQENNCKYKNY